jgi:GNAT superfamily N-acetyltransferase
MKMQDQELVRLQIELEYRVEGDGLVPFPGSTEQARFIVYRFKGGYTRFYRIDIPVQLRLELGRIDSAQVFASAGLVQEIMNAYSRCASAGIFESCSFVQLPPAEAFPNVERDGKNFIIRVEDEVACRTWSERSNDRSAEVAVETLPAYQRRGFARQAVRALAASEMEKGKVVFYSYKIDNLASRALGHSLGVVPFATCIAFD